MLMEIGLDLVLLALGLSFFVKEGGER